jgi:diacylglycerol kinase
LVVTNLFLLISSSVFFGMNGQVQYGITFTLMRAFLSRLGFALQGWIHFFRTEANGRIQAVVSVVVVAAGFFFKVSLQEWLWILLCIGMVTGLEMVNTSIETLSNRLHPERHPDIKIVKDVAAGAVLWASVVSIIIGVIIFLPKLLEILG